MNPSRRSTFLKTWLGSLLGGFIVIVAFLILSAALHWFSGTDAGFIEFFIAIGIGAIGNYLGAGIVGLVLINKQNRSLRSSFVSHYLLYSLLSGVIIYFILAVAAPLVVAVSLIAPICVIAAWPTLQPSPRHGILRNIGIGLAIIVAFYGLFILYYHFNSGNLTLNQAVVKIMTLW